MLIRLIRSLSHNKYQRYISTFSFIPKQFVWERDSSLKFRTALQSRDTQRMIHEFLIDNRLARNAVENILITTAKRCLKIKVVKKRHIKSSSNKKWFDKECRLKSNLNHRDPLNIILREGYHTVLKQYKSLLAQRRNEYYPTQISELENTVDNSDSRNFWNCLKSMNDSVKETSIPLISEEIWMPHFQSLHSNEPLNLHQEATV